MGAPVTNDVDRQWTAPDGKLQGVRAVAHDDGTIEVFLGHAGEGWTKIGTGQYISATSLVWDCEMCPKQAAPPPPPDPNNPFDQESQSWQTPQYQVVGVTRGQQGTTTVIPPSPTPTTNGLKAPCECKTCRSQQGGTNG